MIRFHTFPLQALDSARGTRREEESAHLLGISVLSGSHIDLVKSIIEELASRNVIGVPMVVGGIIPPHDADELRALGVAAVYTPKDADLNLIAGDILELISNAQLSTGESLVL